MRTYEYASFRTSIRLHRRNPVGYSEKLSDALALSSDTTKCQSPVVCRTDKDFDVKELPLDKNGTHTDSFAIDKKCEKQCAKDAVEFIRFVNSEEMFLWELLPAGAPPTYLLRAKASLYSNEALLAKAHLYPNLKNIIQDAAVPSALSLSEELRNAGRQLDGDLPH